MTTSATGSPAHKRTRHDDEETTGSAAAATEAHSPPHNENGTKDSAAEPAAASATGTEGAAKQSTEAAQAPSKHDLHGACHCKKIRFLAKDVDLAKLNKCNCTGCNSWGLIGAQVQPGNLVLIDGDGKEIAVRHENATKIGPPELGHYNFGGTGNDKQLVYWHHCKECGTKLFATGYVEVMGGEFMSVNVRTFDLKPTGLDLKDLTELSKMTYYDGLSNTWGVKVGEPWPMGAW